MSKQNNNEYNDENNGIVGGDGSIVMSPEKPVKSTSAPKVIVSSIIAVNAMILATSPILKTQASDSIFKSVFFEQGKNDGIPLYPVVQLSYESGKLIDKDNNEFAVSNQMKMHNNIDVKSTVDITFQQIIGDLRKENAVLRNRLNNSLPIHTLVYMIVSSISGSVATTLLFIRFILNVYIIDPYYLICTLIISLGLFFTAFTSLKDWKDNLLK